MTVAAQRKAFVGWLNWGIAHEPSIHYAQSRPIPESLPKGHLPLSTDCSGLLTLFAKWSGMPDPNGQDYDGSGYTGTLLNHLDHIEKADAVAGDLGVFAEGADSTHVFALLQSGRYADPTILSHGFEGGPLKMTLSREKAYHSGESLTFLRVVDPQKFFRFEQGNGWSEPKSFAEVVAQLKRIQQDKTQDRIIQVRHFKNPL